MAKKPPSHDRARPVNTLGRALSLGAVASVANLVGSLVRGKAAAILIGPTGLGTIAEVTQVATLAFVPNTLAVGAAYIHQIAVPTREQNADAVARVHSAAFTLSVSLALVGMPSAFAIGWISLPDYRNFEGASYLLLASLLAAVTTQQSLYRQAMVSVGALQAMTKLGVAYSALSTLLVVTGVWMFGIAGHFGAYLIATVAMLPLFARTLHQQAGWARWRLAFSWDTPYAKSAFSLGGATFLTAIITQGALLSVRSDLAAAGGSALNGLFQAAWALGQVHFTTIMQSLGQFVFPRYASAASTEELRTELRAADRFIARMFVPAILIASALGKPAMVLLYSEAFRPAGTLLLLMLATNLLRVFTWPYVSALLYRNRPGVFALTQTVFWLTFAALSATWVPIHLLTGVGAAFFTAQAVSFVVVRACVWFALGIATRLGQDVAVVAGSLVLGAAGTLPNQPIWWPITLVSVAILWMWRAGLLTAAVQRLRR